ncbi:MAG TPA: PLP-dependent transferase, partial [Chlorobaculum sp.]|nr:PLP-dependent transferase [Chlorobaculum sp.]
RAARHSENALELANWLETHPAVEKVIYPGSTNHPQYALALKQQKGQGGGIISVVLKGGREAAISVLSRTQLFTLAESLGGIESLIEHPASMTHASIPPDVRQKNGIVEGLIRLSVGIEDVEDLRADLTQALEQ